MADRFVLRLDAKGRAIAQKRIARELAGATQWEETNGAGRHSWSDRGREAVCERCGVYKPIAEEWCDGGR